MKHKLNNLRSIYKKKENVIITVILMLALGAFFTYATQYQLIRGNLGVLHANIIVVLQGLLVVLFPINVTLLFDKIRTAASMSHKQYGSGALGSFFGVLVLGCPACSIGLASFLGLASILSSLPFFGTELKVLGVGLLFYSTNSLLKNVNICEIK